MAEELEYKKVAETINDFANDNLYKLAQLFPAAVKDGEVDFEALKQELGAFKEVGSEKYELTWTGKQNAKKVALEDVSGKTLNYSPEDSKNPETTENLYIEGDNLEVLKLLRQNYYGAIKMIYIDPPYNTGNDFVYNDKFAMKKKDSQSAEGTRSELGEVYQVNSKSQNRYHANWLNMMYPRLKVAKDLLTEDGVIFISIDDGEIAQSRKICDEIFGEGNFIGSILWKKKTNGNNMGLIPPVHDYVLAYAKSIGAILDMGYVITQEFLDKTYKNPDNDLRGPWTTMDLSANHKGPYFSITNTDNGQEFLPPEGRYWVFNEEEVLRRIEDGRIIFGKSGTARPVQKVFALERSKGKIRAESWWDNHGMNEDATKELKELFEQSKLFTHPKPSKLIYHLTKIATNPDDSDIILDFFSGSGTTAHAVMQLNAEDEYNCRFILVQLPELTEEKSEAYKAVYKNICEIGKERIRRAGDKIIAEHQDLKGKLDIGFKVFKVADTNIKWNHQTELDEQFTVDTAVYTPDLMDFMPDAKDQDIVYEVMLRQNDVPLSSTLETLTEIGQRTYLYANSYLICLETEITVALVDKLAALNPLPIKFIFRDSAFQDDIALKDETFRRLKALIEKNAGSSKKTYTIEFI